MSSEYEKLVEACRFPRYGDTATLMEMAADTLESRLPKDADLVGEQHFCIIAPKLRAAAKIMRAALSALPPASPAPARVEVEPIAGGAGTVVTNAYPVGGYFDPKPPVAAPPLTMVPKQIGVCSCNSPHAQSLDGSTFCTRCGRHIPTPTAPRETAEAFADRLWNISPRTGWRAAAAAVISARDATWQADLAAKDREIERLTRENEKQRADLVTHYQGAIDTHYKPRIAERDATIKHLQGQVDGYERRVDDLMKALTAARLAEREAGGDPELLETARQCFRPVYNSMPEGKDFDEIAGDVVFMARALHSALSDRGQG